MENEEGGEPKKLSLLGLILSFPLWLWIWSAVVGSLSVIKSSVDAVWAEQEINADPTRKVLQAFLDDSRFDRWLSLGIVLVSVGIIVAKRVKAADRPAQFSVRELLWAMALIGPGLAAYYWAAFIGAQSALVAYSVGIAAIIAVGSGMYLLLRVRPAT